MTLPNVFIILHLDRSVDLTWAAEEVQDLAEVPLIITDGIIEMKF